MSSNIFDRLSFLSLFLVIVLLPVFALPFTNIPVEISKGLLLVIGLAITVILWAIARFFDGRILLPRSKLFVSGAVVLLTLLLSSLFSQTPKISLFGTMFDVGSFWFIFAAMVLMFMTSLIFRSERQAKMLLGGIILASMLVLIFQSLHLFIPNILSLGILSGKTGNLVGAWNTLGLFTGFATLMFLLVVEFFPISKLGRLLLQFFLLLGVLLVAVINFPLVWILLGISALLIFVYKASASFHKEGEEVRRHFPFTAFIIVLVALVFFIAGPAQFPGNYLATKLGISAAEVSPDLGGTFIVAKSVIWDDPVLGLGPNRFMEAWAKYKPQAVNSTLFWDVPFESGSGVFPTYLATVGVLGILAWISFIALFFGTGVRAVFSNFKNGVNWEIMAFFVLSLYLFISLLFYATGPTLILLFFAFTGVFVGLGAAGAGKDIEIYFLGDHRKSFFSNLALIVLVISSVVLAFKYVESFASVSYLRQAMNTTDVLQAEAAINKAINLNSNDSYHRIRAQIYVAKLNNLAQKGVALTEAEKSEFEAIFKQAVASAQFAAMYYPDNYQNHRLLGAIYETAGALGVKSAYQSAADSYRQAALLNPFNPALRVGIARAYVAQGNTAEALKAAEEALALAPTDQSLIDYVNSLKGKSSTVPQQEE